MRPSHHYAKLSKSDRLQSVLKFIKSRKEVSSMEIIHKCGVVGPSTAVSEIRAQGYDIKCERRGHISYFRLVA